MSQEQKNRVAEGDVPVTPLSPTSVDASAVEESQKAQEEQGSEGPAGATTTPAKKRIKRKTRLVNVEEISPRPSYWPLALAFSLAIVLFGIIAGPVVVVVGIILALVSVGGWILERR